MAGLESETSFCWGLNGKRKHVVVILVLESEAEDGLGMTFINLRV